MNTLPFEIIILNQFLNLNDLKLFSSTNKYYRQYCKTYIKLYIQKLNQISVYICKAQIFPYHLPTYMQEQFHQTYQNQLWYNIFKNKLKPELLAVYYANFLKTFHFFKQPSYTKQNKLCNTWKCIAYPDGFIKTIANKSTIDQHVSYFNEIIITIKTVYNHHIQYHENGKIKTVIPKLDYIEIDYQYNFKTSDSIHIDKDILKMYLSNNTFSSIFSPNDNCKSYSICEKWCGNNQECQTYKHL